MSLMSPEQRMLIEWGCTRLVSRFNLLNNGNGIVGSAACFVEDGSYLTPIDERPVVGRDALLASFRAKPPRTFRHIVTIAVVDVISQGETRV